jgi:hypothetical protein
MSPILAPFCWIGGGGAALGLFLLLRPTGSGRVLWSVLLGALGMGAALFATLAALLRQPLEIWLPPAALVAVGLACWFVRTDAARRLAGAAGAALRSRKFQAASLLVCCPAFAAIWAACNTLPADFEPNTLPAELGGGERNFQEIDPTPATTDRGRPVRVRNRVPPTKFTPEFLARQSALLRTWGLSERVITMPDQDMDCNCHGWAFTGGRYWILSEQVQGILDDNGYREVLLARPGDLIIYREVNDDIIHTGVVRTVGDNGPLLVESKWGGIGRFVHAPDTHCYGDLPWKYYRSARAGHILRGLADSPAPSQPQN